MTIDPSELIGLLTLGIHDTGVYFAEHARVRTTADTLAARFEAMLGRAAERSLFLGVVDGRLVHDGKLLLGSTLIAKRLIDVAIRFRSGGFLFRRGIRADELVGFFGVCASSRAASESLDEARRMLRAAGVTNVELSPPHGSPGWLGDVPADGGVVAAPARDAVAAEVVRNLGGAIPAFQRLRQAVESSHAGAERGHELDVNASRTTVEQLLGAMAERPAEVLHLARYPDHASYTVGHSVRVALLALAVARHIGFEEHVLVEIGTAGLLHDVGKSRIPHGVLFKRGALDAEERALVARHPVLGAQILLGSHDAPALGIAAAFGHHLRHDRTGYPSFASWGVAGRVTALVQVCDVFEALTAVRPYKPSLTPRRAYEIMLSDPGAFDPSAFAAFVDAMGLYPPGSRVRLTSGEEALVLRVGRDPALPLIELTRNARGDEIPEGRRPLVNLARQYADHVRRIDDVILDDLPAGASCAEENAAGAAAAPVPKPPACCHDAARADHAEHAAH